jgi:hypothetical protein
MADIDVVIPTVEGREDSLARCIASYEENTAPGVLEFIVVENEPTCGQAWIKGTAGSKAPYVHLTADDLEVTSATWAGVCMETTDAGELPCPIVRRPDGSIESCGGDMNKPACLISEMQPDRTPVDFSVLPFFSREQADRIGMIGAHYMTDVYASHRGRQLGYETVVCHGYELIHHRSNVRRLDISAEDHRLYNEALA